MATNTLFMQHVTAGHDTDSDTDGELGVVTNERKIRSYWYEFSDEEEKTETHIARSKEEKSFAAIQALIDEISLNTNDCRWTEAERRFKSLLSAVGVHCLKFRQTPMGYLEFLQYADYKDELTGKTKEDFANASDFQALKKLVASIEEEREKLKKEIEDLDAEDDMDDEFQGAQDSAIEQDEEHDEAYFSDRISPYATEKKSKAEFYLAMARECKSLGFVAAQVSAIACAVDIQLDVEGGKTCVPPARWWKAFESFKKMFETICQESLSVSENFKGPIKGVQCVVIGGMLNFLSKFWLRLREYSRSISVNEKAYLDIPYYENQLVELAESLVQYYLSKSQKRNASECATVILEMVGYRRPAAHKILLSKMTEKPTLLAEDLVTTIRNINHLVSPYCSKVTAKMTVCYLAYQLAMIGLYREGRDTLLRAGVRDFLETDSAETLMTLGTVYNRAVAQLGLAAFIAGDMYETYQLLGSIWSHDQPEIILGQKTPGNGNDDPKLTFIDNMVPHHMHIPYQHLELAAMLSALVIDTTKEAKNPYDRNQRDHQRYFHQAIVRKPTLIGYPSTTQERIGSAYKLLRQGDFKGAKAIVEGMAGWQSLPDGKKALSLYLDKLKEAALRIFCLTNRCNFSSFSVSMLSLKYDLSATAVKDVINQIISENDSLIAYWDRDEEFLFVDRSNTTRLQHLVIGTTNTVSTLVPFTERRQTEGRGRGRGGRGRMDLRNK